MSHTVRCVNCGHENAEDARYCSACGRPLSVTCSVCGTEADPGDRFCRNCGSALSEEATGRAEAESSARDDLSRYLPEELLAKMRSARDGRAMEGERRTVTMLFADIQGSTSAAESLDPEDWAEIMNGAFERLIAPIYRYEGTLAQLRGDAVLAFFGAPIAHEDDPVRALRAGLEMVEAMAQYSDEVEQAWGIPTHVRVGINTGLVVVGAMGSDLRVEYTALGDAINVAARMEQTADPDTVRVTGRTLALTRGLFETEELGGVEVKGKAEPVQSHRVIRYVGERPGDEKHRIVGRRAELDRLGEIRRRALAGSGNIVSVIAEAGVGKSRLLREFADSTGESTDLATRFDQDGQASWLSGASRSYESREPFSTIRDMLSHWWSRDGGPAEFSRIEEAVAMAGLEDRDAASYLGHIAGSHLSESATQFLEGLNTRVLNTKANEALVSYFEALMERRPVFVVLEDLHWSDDLSLALVEALMNLAETGPLCLIVSMRPYRDETSWRIQEVADRKHHHRHVVLKLRPLDAEESASLLGSLLEMHGLSPEARQGILDRSEGNPLYIEQMAMAVRELGPGQLSDDVVPSSLAGLLTARLDRLEEHTRYLVQMASVLGSEFDRGMLDVLSSQQSVDNDVTDLLKRGILVEAPDEPGTLAFGHALIQEVAYETILKRTRRDLHRRVAEHLISSEGPAAEIAHHLVAAEQVQEAFPYLIEAGASASRSMALADAIEFLTEAIDNVPSDADPDLIQRAHERLGEAYSLIPDLSQSAASFQRLYQFGQDNERPSAQIAALNRLAYTTASLGRDLDRAHEYLVDARRIAEESHDDMGLAEYHMNACFVASLGGQMSEAAAHDEETVKLGERYGVESIRLNGLVRRAINYVALLDLEHAVPAVDTALREAGEAGMEEAVATVESAGQTLLKLVSGDIQGALEQAEEAGKTLERYESFFLGMNRQVVGTALYQLGHLEDALSRFVDLQRVAARAHQPFTAAAGLSGMALIYATAGMEEDIPRLRQEAEEKLAGPLGEFQASSVLADFGFVELMLGNPGKATEDFTRGLTSSSTTVYIEKPRLLAGQALALCQLGRIEEAEGALADAEAMVEEKSLGLYRALLGYSASRVHVARGDTAEAMSRLRAAREHAMQTGQRPTLVQILEANADLAMSIELEESARDDLRQARTIVEAMADEIADQDLRRNFQSRWLSATTSPDVDS